MKKLGWGVLFNMYLVEHGVPVGKRSVAKRRGGRLETGIVLEVVEQMGEEETRQGKAKAEEPGR